MIQWSKGHGRVECREVWLVDSRKMTAYLDTVLHWPGLQLSGRIRRSRQRSGQTTWESQTTYTWISSADADTTTAKEIAQALRGHWTVENGIFRVRDVSYDEDRLHGRKIAPCLSCLRNAAINLIRHQGYAYIPDGRRDFAARPGQALSLISQRLIL